MKKILILLALPVVALLVWLHARLSKSSLMSVPGSYPKSLANVLLTEGVRPDLVPYIVAQAYHETGNFASNVFKTLNNVFGWKYVGSKYQLAPGTKSPEGNNYAKYATIEDSARDQAAYFKRRKPPVKITPQVFAEFLFSQGYFTQNKAGNAVTIYKTGIEKWLPAALKSIV